MKNGNQPINPCVIEGRQGFGSQPTIHNETVYGLTKREYFAGLAMQGMMANRWTMELGNYSDEMIITQSIGLADELLKQLGE